jgi:hypothetical protein
MSEHMRDWAAARAVFSTGFSFWTLRQVCHGLAALAGDRDAISWHTESTSSFCCPTVSPTNLADRLCVQWEPVKLKVSISFLLCSPTPLFHRLLGPWLIFLVNASLTTWVSEASSGRCCAIPEVLTGSNVCLTRGLIYCLL